MKLPAELADGDGSHGTPCSGSSLSSPVRGQLPITLMYTFELIDGLEIIAQIFHFGVLSQRVWAPVPGRRKVVQWPVVIRENDVFPIGEFSSVRNMTIRICTLEVLI